MYNDIENYSKLQKKVKKYLTKSRYIHTLGVAYTASSMAMAYGINYYSAYVAGMLHDVAKCMEDDELIQYCNEKRIDISKSESKMPFLLHAKVGAYIAKEKFDINDDDIINAIRYHTTGRIGMSLLEKIVYIADYIEPGRGREVSTRTIRQLAYNNIDKSMALILDSTIIYLTKRGLMIDEHTYDTYNYYKELGEKDESYK